MATSNSSVAIGCRVTIAGAAAEELPQIEMLQLESVRLLRSSLSATRQTRRSRAASASRRVRLAWEDGLPRALPGIRSRERFVEPARWRSRKHPRTSSSPSSMPAHPGTFRENAAVGSTRHRHALEGRGDVEEIVERPIHRPHAGPIGADQRAVDVVSNRIIVSSEHSAFGTNAGRTRPWENLPLRTTHALAFGQRDFLEVLFNPAPMEGPVVHPRRG